MTLLPENAMIQTPNDPGLVKLIQQQISDQLNGHSTWLSKAILPALATLIPTAVIAVSKWAQDHTHSRRSVQLTQRISELAKNISELPVLPFPSANAAVSPQSALTAELESALRELTAIQIRESRHPRNVSVMATVTTKLRAALLLYWPKGFAAWTLHLAFYLYSVFMFFVLVAVVSDQTTPFFNTQSLSTFIPDLFGFLFVFGLVGIPPVIIRYFAARIHRKQCAAMQPAVPPPAIGTEETQVPAS
jgi:hypothetical protein